jgi:hypothetical protein
MTLRLFGDAEQGQAWREELCPGAVVLCRFDEAALSVRDDGHLPAASGANHG